MIRAATLAVLVLTLQGLPAPLAADTRLITLNIPADTARQQISVVVRPNLSHTSKLPTDALRLARQAMLDDLPITDADLRTLADHGDGLAAQTYVRRLAVQRADPSDIAYYGTIAVSTGRVWSLPDVVAALHRLNPKTEPPERTRAYAEMLYPHAWAGNSLAMDALIDLNGEGKLFGPMSEDTRKRIVAQDDETGDGRAALRLSLVLLQKPRLGDKDRALLQRYLDRAAASDNLTVKATAANILALRQPEPTKAASTP